MKPTIHYFPLEHLEQRYTRHLDNVITEHLLKAPNIKGYDRYYPDMMGREKSAPPKGCFLNAQGTIEFKMRQLADLARYWDDVEEGDILFFSDLWFPGLESVRYMEHFTKKKVKIRGLLHAGSFTDTDEVRKLERWAAPLENSWFDQIDQVFVGSEFMKKEVCSRRLLPEHKVTVTGFPLDPRLKTIKPKWPRENIVVFNGRDHEEKQPHLFAELANNLGHIYNAEFVWTQQSDLSKPEYYNLLSKAKVVVSFALQENFGFGILEAAYLGCYPIVPNRLVYPEFFRSDYADGNSKGYLYQTYEEAERMISKILSGDIEVPKVGSRKWYNDKFFKIPTEWFKV